MRRRYIPLIAISFLFYSLSFSEIVSGAKVTLDSIEIYKTHEWFNMPTVYFRCKGENKTILPDVKKKNVSYSFKGEESWQPLTEIENKKCKRCGIYEEDTIKSDDVFDEWEFCPSDFTTSDGKHTRVKDGEFKATFLCVECVPLVSNSSHSSAVKKEKKGMHWALIVGISVLVSTVFIFGAVTAYRYLKERRKRQEQARFLKLFEDDDDDMEDELGIGPLSNTY